MSDQDEPKTSERDSDASEGDKSEPVSESTREPARGASKNVAAKRRDGAQARDAATKAPAGTPGSRVAVFVLLALVAGGAAGWFGHSQQSKAAAAKADSAPVEAGSGPCNTWEQEICSKSGAESAPCMQAKGATELLTPSTCEVALTTMPATFDKLKVARASCETLVSKLCADLPPGSATCTMVKEKTPSFPTPRCDDMLKQYDMVIAELKQLDAQQGMMGGPGGPGMAPPGMAPPGMAPPGMAPPGMPPQ